MPIFKKWLSRKCDTQVPQPLEPLVSDPRMRKPPSFRFPQLTPRIAGTATGAGAAGAAAARRKARMYPPTRPSTGGRPLAGFPTASAMLGYLHFDWCPCWRFEGETKRMPSVLVGALSLAQPMENSDKSVSTNQEWMKKLVRNCAFES